MLVLLIAAAATALIVADGFRRDTTLRNVVFHDVTKGVER